MEAGQFSRHITLTQVGQTNTGTGWEETSIRLGAVWASRADVSDSEKIAAGAVQGTVRSRFIVRSSTITRQVKPKDRLTEGGLTFEIVGVKELGRRDYIEITADARLD